MVLMIRITNSAVHGRSTMCVTNGHGHDSNLSLNDRDYTNFVA
jgi:hypothetical protein